ncbi:hypothetical protein BU24DRAFT_417411 [Aaosphaeria arxii CBS 175.79]|uniref:Mediator of RNA polymerase II transcription subunit 8 n=1 Tax=Aaosphaeria arxii CBS 175.79 TaxID=1450172 RepID=A0A6A5Y8Q7_9PLEO|nr:uncharacterized protein BU24DRAFT_417411 [Aaosphaeria arxii CBS 175.79]KAF2021788.1 hypothetical protein BU24DRAFT_417411 [Aaosphaeria arxii CBS 175.79]
MSQAIQNSGLNLAPDDVRTLEQLRGRLMRLSRVIEELQSAMIHSGEHPPPWPNMHRSISLINAQLKNLHDFFKDKNEDDLSRSQILSALRTYPVAPFPAEEQRFVLETILRKKPSPDEEKWVEERLRAASEFCRVPEEWLLMLGKTEVIKENRSDYEDEFGGIKRVKVPMDEDDLTALWAEAPATAYATISAFTKALSGDYDDGDESGDEDAAALDAIRRDIGMVDELESTPASETGSGDDVKQPAPLPLGAILKFVSTGASIIPPGVHA